MLHKQTGKQASERAEKQASEQAREQASERESEQESKQTANWRRKSERHNRIIYSKWSVQRSNMRLATAWPAYAMVALKCLYRMPYQELHRVCWPVEFGNWCHCNRAANTNKSANDCSAPILPARNIAKQLENVHNKKKERVLYKKKKERNIIQEKIERKESQSYLIDFMIDFQIIWKDQRCIVLSHNVDGVLEVRLICIPTADRILLDESVELHIISINSRRWRLTTIATVTDLDKWARCASTIV